MRASVGPLGRSCSIQTRCVGFTCTPWKVFFAHRMCGSCNLLKGLCSYFRRPILGRDISVELPQNLPANQQQAQQTPRPSLSPYSSLPFATRGGKAFGPKSVCHRRWQVYKEASYDLKRSESLMRYFICLTRLQAVDFTCRTARRLSWQEQAQVLSSPAQYNKSL